MTRQTSPSPLDQALEWCVRLHDDGVTPAEREAFAQWLAADERHEAAWQRAQQVWGASGEVAQVLASAPAVAKKARRARTWTGWAAAAVVVLAVAGVTLSPAHWADYRTEVAQTRTWTLEDGSSIQLAPRTALDVTFSKGERRIHLYRGEAWFKVAANPARPFVVEAGDATVQALGTAFDVKVDGNRVDVAVTEHKVRVTHPRQQQDVSEGEALHYDRDAVSAPRAVNLMQQLAWREQRLSFKDAPLAEVIEQLQAYSSSRLLVTDSTLDGLSVTAAFDTRQPQDVLESLQVILPIQVSTVGPWLTLIRASENK